MSKMNSIAVWQDLRLVRDEEEEEEEEEEAPMGAGPWRLREEEDQEEVVVSRVEVAQVAFGEPTLLDGIKGLRLVVQR
jgi:hypothetical protein